MTAATQKDYRVMQKLKAKPWLFWYGMRGLAKGAWYRVWYGWVLRKARIGSMFRVYGPCSFQGPGKIIIGNDVHLLGDMIKPVCLATSSPQARIVLGDHVGINGATVVANQSVRIDDHCVIAAHYITDNQNHSLAVDRMTNPDAPIETAPVHIEQNVWIGTLSVVLHGVTVGKNSVIGSCSLVRQDVPANTLAAGNPLRVIRSLDEKQ